MSDSVIHVGNNSQISDGSAAPSEKARELVLTPDRQDAYRGPAGQRPVIILTARIPAQEAIKKSCTALSDFGVFEVNEACAAVPLGWLAEISADPALLNPNGGAIAFGHPFGDSGGRLMTTLAHHVRDNGIRFRT